MLPHLRPLHAGEILHGAFRLYRLQVRARLPRVAVESPPSFAAGGVEAGRAA
jgi:hypothetical protein